MSKEQALELWQELDPYPAELCRLRFNGQSAPVYSVILRCSDLSGADLVRVLKIADAHSHLETYVRARNGHPEMVFTDKT